MADKVPIRTVFDSGGNATGLAEFQSGETVGFIHGGTGLSSLGTAGQFLQVNSGASALEFTSDLNISSISPPSGDITLDSAADIILDADGADIILKDGGTEFGRFTNSSGQLVIKSSSSSTTAMTMSGANVTIAGNLTVTGTTEGDSNITLGDAATDTVTFGGTISGDLVFEGSSDDSFETTLRPGNPTADITLTLPSTTSDTLVGLASSQTLTNKTLTTPVISTISNSGTITLPTGTRTLVARDTTDTLTNKTITSPTVSGLTLSDSSIIFEGSTADSFETTMTVTDPTADRTITLPNATGTLITHGMFSGDATVATSGALTLATVNSNTGAFGSSTAIPIVTVNGKGLITAMSTASITTSLTVGADSGSDDAVALATDTLNFTGGSNITTTVSNNDISIALDASPSITNLTVGGNIVFEGSTADSFETTLQVTDPTADRTLTLPNRTGTVALTSDTAFPESTIVDHPAASGNVDLAGGETPFESIVDAFSVPIADIYDHMEPRGSTVTVDLGSVA